jgi:hypothetical protein
MSDLNHANQFYNNTFNQINTNSNAYTHNNNSKVNDLYPSIQSDQNAHDDQILNGNKQSKDRNHKRSKQREEIARQDIIITPNGPVEILRKDLDGKTRALSPRKLNELYNQYSIGNSYETQRNLYTKNKSRRSKYKNYINPYDYHYQHHHSYDDEYNDKFYSRSNYTRHNYSKYFARKPFDWYKPKHAVLMDDFNEVIPLYDTHPYEKVYCPHSCYSHDPHRRSRRYYDSYPSYYEHHYEHGHDYKTPHYSRRDREDKLNLRTSYSNDTAGHFNPRHPNDYDNSYINSVQIPTESSDNNKKSNYLKYLENSKSQRNTQYNLTDFSSSGGDLDEQTKNQFYKY